MYYIVQLLVKMLKHPLYYCLLLAPYS